MLGNTVIATSNAVQLILLQQMNWYEQGNYHLVMPSETTEFSWSTTPTIFYGEKCVNREMYKNKSLTWRKKMSSMKNNGKYIIITDGNMTD